MNAQRRAKIVATIGPATDTEDSLEALLAAGVDVVRLNFSHGTHEDHLRRL
jgi:pyruvate kinase